MITVIGYTSEENRNNRHGDNLEIGIAHTPEELKQLRREAPQKFRFLDLVDDNGNSVFYQTAERYLESESRNQQRQKQLQLS